MILYCWRGKIQTGENHVRQGLSKVFVFFTYSNNVVEYYGKRIEILHGHPFEGWPNRARPSHPFWQLLVGWPCPVRSALKRTPVQDFNSSSIMVYNIITTTYQKIGDLFCPVQISGLSAVCITLSDWHRIQYYSLIHCYSKYFVPCTKEKSTLKVLIIFIRKPIRNNQDWASA